MFNVTNAACGFLNEMLERFDAPRASGMRIVSRPDGLKTTVDTERDGDLCFGHEGRTVLLVQRSVAEELGDCTLDVDDDRSRLVCFR